MDWKTLTISDAPVPMYRRFADTVRSLIKEQVLAPGTWLPSSRDLSEDIKIHRHTITAALDELVAEGWLIVEKRRGYQVNDDIEAITTRVTSKKLQLAREVNLGPFSPAAKVNYNFQSGLPDLRLFPFAEFRSELSETMKERDISILDYSSPLGHPFLREQLQTYIAHMRGIKDREIIVTNGAQEAIFITAQLLIKPGDYVAMEELSYPPAREAFKVSGARLLSLQMDDEGVVPEHLAEQIKRHPLKLLFLTPTHQFPTTKNMSASRRLAVYNLAATNGVHIIEDDYDHEFHFTSTPPQPMVSIDQAGCIIYISTFSKLLFPSSRLAFMAVPKNFAEAFAQFRRIVSHQNDSIMQQALATWILNKGLMKHLKKMRVVYEERLNTMEDMLSTLQANGLRLSWRRPDGGMALWLNIGTSSTPLAERASKKGIFVTPESYYRMRKGKDEHLRLGFSNQGHEEIRQGLLELAKVIRDE